MLDSGGERAGGRSAANVRVTVDGTGVPLTPRKRGTGAPLTLPRRAGPPTALKAALLPRGNRCLNVGVFWVPGRFSAFRGSARRCYAMLLGGRLAVPGPSG